MTTGQRYRQCTAHHARLLVRMDALRGFPNRTREPHTWLGDTESVCDVVVAWTPMDTATPPPNPTREGSQKRCPTPQPVG